MIVLATLSGVAWAQQVASADPTDSRAPSVPLRFDSGLKEAGRDAEVDPAARWREHNDRVRSIGGHAGYLKAGRAKAQSAPPQAPGPEARR